MYPLKLKNHNMGKKYLKRPNYVLITIGRIIKKETRVQ